MTLNNGKFYIGDHVKIISTGGLYPVYEHMAYNVFFLKYWQKDKIPDKTHIYTIIGKEKHQFSGKFIYAIESQKNRKQYIIDDSGLKPKADFDQYLLRDEDFEI